MEQHQSERKEWHIQVFWSPLQHGSTQKWKIGSQCPPGVYRIWALTAPFPLTPVVQELWLESCYKKQNHQQPDRGDLRSPSLHQGFQAQKAKKPASSNGQDTKVPAHQQILNWYI